MSGDSSDFFTGVSFWGYNLKKNSRNHFGSTTQIRRSINSSDRVTEYIIKDFNKKRSTWSVSVHISKAFDRVWHKKMKKSFRIRNKNSNRWGTNSSEWSNTSPEITTKKKSTWSVFVHITKAFDRVLHKKFETSFKMSNTDSNLINRRENRPALSIDNSQLEPYSLTFLRFLFVSGIKDSIRRRVSQSVSYIYP